MATQRKSRPMAADEVKQPTPGHDPAVDRTVAAPKKGGRVAKPKAQSKAKASTPAVLSKDWQFPLGTGM